MKKPIQIPFDKNGDQMTWAGYSWSETEWRDNYEFEAVLKYNGFSRGRSALNIEWLDLDKNVTYQSGMGLLDGSLLGNNSLLGYVKNGVFNIEGKFTFKKQGTAYLLDFVQ